MVHATALVGCVIGVRAKRVLALVETSASYRGRTRMVSVVGRETRRVRYADGATSRGVRALVGRSVERMKGILRDSVADQRPRWVRCVVLAQGGVSVRRVHRNVRKMENRTETGRVRRRRGGVICVVDAQGRGVRALAG